MNAAILASRDHARAAFRLKGSRYFLRIR